MSERRQMRRVAQEVVNAEHEDGADDILDLLADNQETVKAIILAWAAENGVHPR